MKYFTRFVKGGADEPAGVPGCGGDQLAKDRKDPVAGYVEQIANKGLWQDVEFVPQIVEKIPG